MDTALYKHIISLWEKYFPGVNLPIGYFYTDQVREEELKDSVTQDRCLIGNLKRVQDGYSFVEEGFLITHSWDLVRKRMPEKRDALAG